MMKPGPVIFVGATVFRALAGCGKRVESPAARSSAITAVHEWNLNERIGKTEAEWQQQLTPEQYEVLRKQGTERAFTGGLHDNHDDGTYVCAGCGLARFGSETKFDSGTGWPSFGLPLKAEHVGSTSGPKFSLSPFLRAA